MKKIGLILLCLLSVVGCSLQNNKAWNTVETYLNEYKGLSDNVLKSIDEETKKEELNENQMNIYKDILKRQYRDINYTIENESYNGDNATVTVKITVYDLYKAQIDARNYLENHQEEFLTNGTYDSEKYLEYKLDKMKNTNETITYIIVFKLINIDGKWQVEQPDERTLEKIHGIYNYKEE